jgi:uncharacterized protein (TIGR01319 family)
VNRVLAVDFGSTYTKGVVFDCGAAEIMGVAYSPSTVAKDITIGLRAVLEALRARCGFPVASLPAFACSSAAGGLRVAVIGLVPVLSLEAAQRAALGAGARIVAAHGYKLTPASLRALTDARPDIVLLAGGTDGGDEETILHNARALAQSTMSVPVIVAGNACAADECVARLEAGGKQALSAPNLMPEVDRIEAAPVHTIIRDLFIRRITHAKGIDCAKDHIDLVADIIPTPSAVLEAARLLADGVDGVHGLGDTLVLDIGGATTDVYSVAKGAPTRPGVMVRGLPELRIKRTVEGDVGMRISAPSIVERIGQAELHELARIASPGLTMTREIGGYADVVADCIDYLPQGAEEFAFDQALARAAVRTAVQRHAGSLREVYTPSGYVMVQEGKDLSEVSALVGIGGVLAHGADPRFVLDGALGRDSDRFNMLPRECATYLDKQYVLYGVGLLSAADAPAAFAIARNALESV